MFRVKICGVTRLSDALLVAEAGGGAIGFNFYPQSVRYIRPDAAREITADLPASLLKIGVFVNASSQTIIEICDSVGLDGAQLHGEEPAALAANLPRSISVIRAFRLQAVDLSAAIEHLNQCASCGRMPDAVLVDAHQSGSYGGTGRTINWQELAAQKPLLGELPLILAGGLTPENVRPAVATVRPWGVDSASGVEVSPGVKDPEKVRQFIAEALQGQGEEVRNPTDERSPKHE